MLKSLYVNGRPVEPPDHDTDRVSLELCSGYATHHCHRCGEELTQTADGYESTATGSLNCPTETTSGVIDGARPHDPRPIPLAWCNHAAIATNEDHDAVTVMVSVGDPRGGFCFTVRRVPDQAYEHAGRLVLHTPHPGEAMPHTLLTELRPGMYLVGE